MTIIQRAQINEVHEKIKEIRSVLDDIMYNNSMPVNNNEYGKLRESYNLICEANDKLP